MCYICIKMSQNTIKQGVWNFVTCIFYIFVTFLLHFCYIFVTFLLHFCYMFVTCFVTFLLHFCCILDIFVILWYIVLIQFQHICFFLRGDLYGDLWCQLSLFGCIPHLPSHLLCLVIVHGLLVDAQCLVVCPRISVVIGVLQLLGLASSLQGQL